MRVEDDAVIEYYNCCEMGQIYIRPTVLHKETHSLKMKVVSTIDLFQGSVLGPSLIDQRYTSVINYCPWCGKNLKEIEND
jgi:hypothetical protein